MTWKKTERLGPQFAYKEIKQPDGYTTKLIIKMVDKRMGNYPCGIFLVRDGQVIRYWCKSHRGRPVSLSQWGTILAELNINYRAIFSRDLGALYKKYNIPASARRLAKYSMDQFKFCTLWADLRKIGFCPEQCNTIMTGTRHYNAITCLITHFTGKVKSKNLPLWEKLSDKQRINCFLYAHVYDLFNMHAEIHKDAPELLESIDYRESLQALHDNFSRISMRLNGLKIDMEIPYDDNARQLEQMAPEGFRIKLAKNGNELIHWGELLKHCIGGYTNKALRGAQDNSIILGGVYIGDNTDPTWTFAIRWSERIGWRFMQFYGLRNTEPPHEVYQLFLEKLREHHESTHRD